MRKQNTSMKVVILGDGRVGKTSLMLRYAHGTFHSEQQPTQNASFISKPLKTKHNKNVTLNLWDTAGQEKYDSIAPVYYRDADGAVVVYDINNQQSFLKMEKWIGNLKDSCDNKNIVIAIAANQVDLKHTHSIDDYQAKALAQTHQALFYSTSAKTGEGVAHLMEDLIEKILPHKAKAKDSFWGMPMKNNKPKKRDCC